jgi:hypothetical protein
LWERCLDDLWSLATALLEDDNQAVAALGLLRVRLRDRARGLATDIPWRTQLFGLFWEQVADRMELRPLGSILANAGADGPLDDADRSPQEQVLHVLASTPRELTLVYLFNLLGRCSTADIAAFSGASELEVRKARAAVAWRLVGGRPA